MNGSKSFTVNFSWANVLAFVIFFSYAFAGSVIKKDNFINLILSLAVFLIFLFFLLLPHLKKINSAFRDSISFNYSFFLTVLFLSAVSLVLNRIYLFNPLHGDQYHHAAWSQFNSMRIINYLSQNTSCLKPLENMPCFALMHIVNVLFAACALAVFFILRRFPVIIKIIFYSVFFWIFRIWWGDGHGDPHPPFRLFFLMLNNLLFSVTAFSFRFSQNMIFIVFCAWFIEKLKKQTGIFTALAAGLAVFTIPLFQHVSVLNEQSVYSFICFSIVLIKINEHHADNRFPWLRFTALAAVVSMVRQPGFMCFFPVYAFYFFYVILKQKKIDWRELLVISIPILAFFPFFLRSLYVGQPAAYYPGESDLFTGRVSLIIRILVSLRPQHGPFFLLNSLTPFWAVFLAVFSIPLFFKKEKSLIYISFFSILYILFYMVRPWYWGTPRYQAEMAGPFVLLAVYNGINLASPCLLGNDFRIKGAVIKRFISAALILFFFAASVYNIKTYMFFPENNMPADEYMNMLSQKESAANAFPRLYKIQSEFVYPYRPAFAEIKKMGYSGNSYILGHTYGNFPFVMQGVTLKELNNLEKILHTTGTGAGADAITENTDIRAVIYIGHIFPQVIDDLSARGWKIYKKFTNNKYGSSILIITRQH
ncbi:MAG: hypothetical protein A2096_07585 [Spirochaetes bacterium GWF1_41_5]|nr:MAG: hypothetical protein A2096_07585 [Spirochaetes bacterium GWF1_41_5]